MTPEELEREYSPSSCIGGDWRPFLEAYRTRSAEARAWTEARGARWQRLPVGPGALPAIELCLPPPGAPAPPAGVALLVYIHGGYWQELSAAESLFAAAGCLAQGHAFAAIDYTLAPAASVAGIVDECRLACRWLRERAQSLGIDRSRIVVAGSSAGAHLAAMAALPEAGLELAGAVLVSGIFRLPPLIATTINHALGLDAAAARLASPALHSLEGFPPSVVAWGEVETAAFKAQSAAFAAQLQSAGTLCPSFEVPARNHFDVVLDLVDPATPLGKATLARL